MRRDYGREILASGFFGFAPRLKNRIMTRIQNKIMNAFGKVEKTSRFDRVFSRVARKIAGAHLYSLKLEVNTRCTLNCKMCYLNRGDTSLPFNVLQNLFDQIRGCGVRIEILGGEPLLRPDLVEIITGSKQRALSPFVSLYTNGIHAEPGVCQKLGRAGLDAALVTLISHKSTVHDEFCGKNGAWKRTVQGIRNLIEAGISVYTFTAIHRENYHDVADIRRYVKSELGAHPTFYQYIPQCINDPIEIDPQQWSPVKQTIVTQYSPAHMDFVRRFYLLTGNACSGGNFVLTVKADGSVQPCPFVSDVPLGNILEQDIWSIYRHRYRSSRLLEFKRTPAECEPCSYRSVCGGGCRAACDTLFGRYDRRDHRCLGPYTEVVDREKILDRLPAFF